MAVTGAPFISGKVKKYPTKACAGNSLFRLLFPLFVYCAYKTARLSFRHSVFCAAYFMIHTKIYVYFTELALETQVPFAAMSLTFEQLIKYNAESDWRCAYTG